MELPRLTGTLAVTIVEKRAERVIRQAHKRWGDVVPASGLEVAFDSSAGRSRGVLRLEDNGVTPGQSPLQLEGADKQFLQLCVKEHRGESLGRSSLLAGTASGPHKWVSAMEKWRSSVQIGATRRCDCLSGTNHSLWRGTGKNRDSIAQSHRATLLELTRGHSGKESCLPLFLPGLNTEEAPTEGGRNEVCCFFIFFPISFYINFI